MSLHASTGGLPLDVCVDGRCLCHRRGCFGRKSDDWCRARHLACRVGVLSWFDGGNRQGPSPKVLAKPSSRFARPSVSPLSMVGRRFLHVHFIKDAWCGSVACHGTRGGGDSGNRHGDASQIEYLYVY